MAKLVVSFEETVVGHYFLDKERFTIGRQQDNDIYLDNPGVSSLHAVIVTISNDHVLEDSASTNGVLVNGEKITKCILQNQDVVDLSGYRLKYVNQRAMSDRDFDKTMITRAVELEEGGSLGHRPRLAKPLLATAVSSARSLKTSFPLGGVQIMSGQQAGEDILISSPLKTFGQPGVQVVMISRRPHGYYATHVEGKKHPRVNGKSIGTEAWLLAENDLIEVGEVELKFFLQHLGPPIPRP